MRPRPPQRNRDESHRKAQRPLYKILDRHRGDNGRGRRRRQGTQVPEDHRGDGIRERNPQLPEVSAAATVQHQGMRRHEKRLGHHLDYRPGRGHHRHGFRRRQRPGTLRQNQTQPRHKPHPGNNPQYERRRRDRGREHEDGRRPLPQAAGTSTPTKYDTTTARSSRKAKAAGTSSRM